MDNRATSDTDRRLFPVSAIAILAIVFAGFARSYYLSAWLSKRVLTPALHAHGLIMTAWVALFFVQTFLVAKNRIDLHRKLGPLGAALGMVVLSLGAFVIVKDVERQAPGAGPAKFLLMFIAFDGLHLLLFAGLVFTALVVRHRSDFHKRLMLLATLSLLPPALGRIVGRFSPESEPAIILVLMTVGVLVIVVTDTVRSRRLHPAFGWGGALVVMSNILTYLAQMSG